MRKKNFEKQKRYNNYCDVLVSKYTIILSCSGICNVFHAKQSHILLLHVHEDVDEDHNGAAFSAELNKEFAKFLTYLSFWS